MSAALGMLALCLFSVIIYMVVSRRRREKLMRSVVASTRQTVAAEDKSTVCVLVSVKVPMYQVMGISMRPHQTRRLTTKISTIVYAE